MTLIKAPTTTTTSMTRPTTRPTVPSTIPGDPRCKNAAGQPISKNPFEIPGVCTHYHYVSHLI